MSMKVPFAAMFLGALQGRPLQRQRDVERHHQFLAPQAAAATQSTEGTDFP